MKSLVVIALVLFVFPAAANACSCIVAAGSEKSHVTREFNEAEAVFLGYVHSEIVREVADNPSYSEETRKLRRQFGIQRERFVRVRVLQVWKGELKADSWIEMHADDGGGVGCGYSAKVDSAYIVFSHATDSYAMISCSNSGRVDVTLRMIPLLDKLAKKAQPNN